MNENVVITKTTPTSSANDRQVGGSHYQTGGVQHWDLFGPDYLIGYATKYMRWRKKGGVEDLEKAIHVIEKLREVIDGGANMPRYNPLLFAKWCSDAGLDWTEQQIVELIMFGRRNTDFDNAILGIRHLIATHTPKSTDVTELLKLKSGKTYKKPKPYADMTNDELREEKERLERANAEATGWGAAVGARVEGIKEIDGMLLARAAKRQRTPEDGAQHATLAPWIVNETWFEDKKNITPELRDKFFRERGPVSLLEPCVISDKIPKQLAGVYRLLNNAWVLRMEDCPADAREGYPSIPRERNMVEYDEMPTWQRAMYDWYESENKFALKLAFAAWHMEAE
jgi:hypothetical protein